MSIINIEYDQEDLNISKKSSVHTCCLIYNFVYVLKCAFGCVNGFKLPTFPPSLFVLEYLISFTYRRHLTTGLKGGLSIVKLYLKHIHSLSRHVNIAPFIRSESNIGKDFRDDNYCHVQRILISWMVLFALECSHITWCIFKWT